MMPATNPKVSWVRPKGFWVVVAVSLLAVSPQPKRIFEQILRGLSTPVAPLVDVDVGNLLPPYRAFWQAVQPVSRSDVEHLAVFYTGLARSVASDPPADRVLTTTASVRAAHRAGLLFLWRGLLNVQPGQYPGLRESMEGVLTDAIGDADVPLNDSLRRSAAACFSRMAELCQSATR